YASVVSLGCAAPFAADRGPVLRAIEKTWRAKMPKRLQLDAALQKRLSAMGAASRWHRPNHEQLLAVVSDPTNHSLLQPHDIELKVDKNRGYQGIQLAAKNNREHAISGESLGSIVQLVTLIHAETPAGHPVRSEMPALIKQTTKLLDHPGLLLDLRSV